MPRLVAIPHPDDADTLAGSTPPTHRQRGAMGLLCQLVLLLVVWCVTPAYGQVCAFGTVPCQGRYGAGCYNPAYAACHDGLVCASGAAPCVGRYGAGCYNPAYAACHDGLVCSSPLQPCIGRHGAQCYNPSTGTCVAGQRLPQPRHRRH